MAENGYVPRLKEHYNSVVCSSLIEKFSYANPMQTPKLDKIVINIGAGKRSATAKKLDRSVRIWLRLPARRQS